MSACLHHPSGVVRLDIDYPYEPIFWCRRCGAIARSCGVDVVPADASEVPGPTCWTLRGLPSEEQKT